MPATGKNALTLGRSVVDLSILEEGTPEGLRKVLELFYQTIVGEGWPSPAQDGDDVYQNVYAQYNGATWTLHAGSPDDPTNPDLISVSAAGSTTIAVEDVGGLVQGATDTIQFLGDVTVTDDGGGHVTVDVNGGGGGAAFTTIDVPSGTDPVATVSGETLTLANGTNITIVGSATDTITINCSLTAGTYIDITAGAISVDFTSIPGYSPSSNQYLNNANGTIQWKDAVAC